MIALKYRPFSLNDIIGLENILPDLKNRSKDIRFPQVSLYEGPSGTGKTTIARIIAGLINCKNPKEEKDKNGNIFKSPCGECASCKTIKEERFRRDTYFLDASEMGIEAVRKISNLVDFGTLFDKNRIIIIDEAQELSKAGKGATLHLLEKIRRNVYFFLCTMNINAFDDAVKSRTQTYKFKPIKAILIAEYLFSILVKENLTDKVPEEFISTGLHIISNGAKGNVRQSLQLLERCIESEYFSEEQIIKNLGLKPLQTKVISQLLKINEKFKSVLPPLEPDEYTKLKQSILKEGCRDAIITWNGFIIDGFNRYEICIKHNIPFKTVKKDNDFKDENEVMNWMITNQLARRNMNEFQKTEYALRFEPVIKERAKEKQIEAGRNKLSQNSAKAIDSRKEIAKLAGVSHDTVSKVKKILEKGDDKDIKKLKSDKVSINKVFKKIKSLEKRENEQKAEEVKHKMDEKPKVIEEDRLKKVKGGIEMVGRYLNLAVIVYDDYKDIFNNDDINEIKSMIHKIEEHIKSNL